MGKVGYDPLLNRLEVIDSESNGSGSGEGQSVLIQYSHSNGTSLQGSQDYFIFGDNTQMGPTVNSSVKLPILGGTVTDILVNTYIGGSFGSGEGSTLTLFTDDGLESYVIGTSIKFDQRNRLHVFSDLSHPVSTGLSYVRLDTANWSSNPTSAKIFITVKMTL